MNKIFEGSSIYRGWMMIESIYENFHNQLKEENIQLINNPVEYISKHHYPESSQFLTKFIIIMKQLIDGHEVDSNLYYSLLEYKDKNPKFLWNLFQIESVYELNKEQFEKAIFEIQNKKLIEEKSKFEKEDLVKKIIDLEFLEISNNYKSGIKEPRSFFELFEGTSSEFKTKKQSFGKKELSNKIYFLRKQFLNSPKFEWYFGFGHKNSLNFRVCKEDNIRILEIFADFVRNLADIQEEEKLKYQKIIPRKQFLNRFS